MRDRATRRVATVLFVDVVDSTRIAADIGDARWRELVATFRRQVRRQLKRLGGREVDTAGDGFFATFDRPASALRAAAAIVGEVQRIGLDVRCGLHTGELERIDGRLGGIAAHIGARVMAEAGAAQVIATSTVRELVVGGAIAFENFRETELKGVPGRWTLLRMASVDGEAIPGPLAADEAAGRRASRGAQPTRPGPLVFGVAAIGLVGVVAIAVYAGARPDPGELATSSASPAASGSSAASGPPEPIALIKVDPRLREVAEIVSGEWDDGLAGLISSNGNLWYTNGSDLVRLDPSTGERLDTFKLPPETYKVDAAFGSLWVGHGTTQYQTIVDKLDPLNYRLLGQLDPGEEVWDHAITENAIYAVSRAEEGEVSELLEFDPTSGDAVDRAPTGFEVGPFYVGVHEDLVTLWSGSRVSLFDPATDAIVATIQGPQVGQGPSLFDSATGLFWAGDRDGATVTPYHISSGEQGIAIGLDGNPRHMVLTSDAIWIAAEEFVIRLDRFSRETRSIPMPEGVTALSIAADEETSTIWVWNCQRHCNEPEL
jgi:hypothetical protein